MKLFNAIATAAIIGSSILAINPAQAGRFYSLKYNIGISKNDGNPRFVISDGSRLIVISDQMNKNPLKDGGYGFMKTYTLDRNAAQVVADTLHEGRNCVDTMSVHTSSKVGDIYEQAMYMSC